MKEENTNYIMYLVNLAQSGRPRAYIDLAALCMDKIYAAAFRILYDADAASEAVKRALMRGWESILLFDAKDSFIFWMKNIAVEYAVDILMQGKGSQSEKTPIQEKNNNELHNLLLSISEEDRVIYILHDLEGYSYSDISPFFPDKIYDELKTAVIKTRSFIMENIGL